MKKVIISISTLALMGALVMIFTQSSCVAQSEQNQDVTTLVRVPELPVSLEFAGERVPLENYDTRESLIREILVTQNMHSRTSITLLLTSRYFPIIEPILEENNIPLDFKYLCMAESGLDANIASSAGAAGLWQLMPAVGRENGMVVGSGVDERYNVEMATRAACRHLQDSYDKFGNWTLAAAAYNLGPAGVKRRMDKQMMDNYYDMFLPSETLSYVFRILSMKLLYENPEQYGYQIPEDEYYKQHTNYKIVTTDAQYIDWSKFAIDNGTTYKMLRELNHWIRDYDYTNNARKKFDVKVPTENFREVE